jgi:hypothetical protein
VTTATSFDEGIFLYTLETKKYEKIMDRGLPLGWLPDGRRVLYREKNSLLTVDVETKKTQPILDKLGAGVAFTSLSHDGRSFLVVRADNQADIWMLAAAAEPAPETQ